MVRNTINSFHALIRIALNTPFRLIKMEDSQVGMLQFVILERH